MSHEARQVASWLIFDVGRSTMSDAPATADSSLRWLSAILTPFVTMSAYLWFSRWPVRWFTAVSDYVGMAVAILAFAVAVLMLRKRASRCLVVAQRLGV
jgi:hypothetical protein